MGKVIIQILALSLGLAIASGCKTVNSGTLADKEAQGQQNKRAYLYKRHNGGNTMLCMAECADAAPEKMNRIQVRAYCKFNRRGISLAAFRDKAMKDYPSVSALVSYVETSLPDPTAAEGTDGEVENKPAPPYLDRLMSQACAVLPEMAKDSNGKYTDVSCGGETQDQLSSDAPENRAPGGEPFCAKFGKG